MKKRSLNWALGLTAFAAISGMIVGSVLIGADTKINCHLKQKQWHFNKLASLKETTPKERNQLIASVIAASYQNVYLPASFNTMPYLAVTRNSFYSNNITNQQLQNQRSLILFLLSYIQANANKAVALDPEFASILNPANVLMNFGLNFAQAIYETNQNMIEIPVTWGTSDTVATSLVDLTIFLDPKLPHFYRQQITMRQTQEITNLLATELNNLNVSETPILSKIKGTSFATTTIEKNAKYENVSANQALLLTYLANQIFSNTNPQLLDLIGTTNVVNCLFLATNLKTFQATNNTLTFQIGWNSNDWTKAYSEKTITINGFGSVPKTSTTNDPKQNQNSNQQHQNQVVSGQENYQGGKTN